MNIFYSYSIQEHSNEEFKEEMEFREAKTGKTYPAHWRDHDHMHTVAGIIVILVYVAEDSEFRSFHILSSRAFNHVRPQLQVKDKIHMICIKIRSPFKTRADFFSFLKLARFKIFISEQLIQK